MLEIPWLNELCGCGSGRPYKDCHLGRFADAMEKATKYEVCLHPDASPETCNGIIDAHTLQKKRVLREIVNNNHVSAIRPHKYDKEGHLKLFSIGWNKASTFNAFCDSHDKVFEPLEGNEFSGSKEQIFLIAYRAICWEYYNKTIVLQIAAAARKFSKDIFDPISIQQQFKAFLAELEAQEAGAKQGRADLEIVKKKMDEALQTKNYSVFNTYEIVMEGPLSVASTGALPPCWSLKGEQLQGFENPHQTQWLSFGIDINKETNKVSIVFLWSNEDTASEKYIESLKDLDNQELAEFLIQILFAYCENTYFSEAWWSSLTDDDRLFLCKLTMNSAPVCFFPQYDLNRMMAPWRILDRRVL